jgi:hypothetical protein
MVLTPIIVAIITWLGKISVAFIHSKYRAPEQKPKQIDTAQRKPLLNMSRRKSFFNKSWFVLLILLLCMAYVLPEVFSPHELTRMALYKIVMGIGLFFFLLIQSSISSIIEVIFKFKSADLELIKSFSKEFKKGDNP